MRHEVNLNLGKCQWLPPDLALPYCDEGLTADGWKPALRGTTYDNVRIWFGCIVVDPLTTLDCSISMEAADPNFNRHEQDIEKRACIVNGHLVNAVHFCSSDDRRWHNLDGHPFMLEFVTCAAISEICSVNAASGVRHLVGAALLRIAENGSHRGLRRTALRRTSRQRNGRRRTGRRRTGSLVKVHVQL